MVVTIHDLGALKRASEHLRGGVRIRLRQLAVQRAAGVIVPTETVAADAVSHLGVERSRVSVIPEAADAAMYPRGEEEIAAVRARLGLPERYLVLVGGLQHPDPGKHIARLAATDARASRWCWSAPTRPWAHELPDVILTGEVGDDDLAAIYSGAHALVLTSENEGFGLPAVEALACGTPVAACEAPALREVLGDRATFVALRGHAGARRRGTGHPAPGARAAGVELGGRRRAAPGASTRPPPRRRTSRNRRPGGRVGGAVRLPAWRARRLSRRPGG